MPQIKRNKDAGSHAQSEPAFLSWASCAGRMASRAKFPLEIYSEMLELLEPGGLVYVGESHRPLTIEATRWKNDLLLLKFEGINDRTEVSGPDQ